MTITSTLGGNTIQFPAYLLNNDPISLTTKSIILLYIFECGESYTNVSDLLVINCDSPACT